ncbi:MAG: response regulator transcription factor [Chloroflexia bacterium]|nr:response regulator transcription factor [Chloroflexia bacterium]
MTQQGAFVLVVDDDPLMCRLVEVLLETQGHSVVTAGDYESAMAAIRARIPDLILLDVQLPSIDGFTIMRQLKRLYDAVPIIMLTARAEMQDRLMGLETGADDYVVKPFEPAELLARVKAVLRRSKKHLTYATDLVVERGGLRLDVPGMTVTNSTGQSALLTPTETRILHRLMSRPDYVISREELTSFAIGAGADTTTNHIDVYIGRIRKKIGDDTNKPRHILTVRGSGYKFQSSESDVAEMQPRSANT